jgi:DNA polymerase elongation subunit (family B)
MLSNIDLKQVLFIDIETVPQYPDYDEVPESMRELWDKKSNTSRNWEDETPQEFYNKAGIFAEFGKIVCISAGYFKSVSGAEKKFRVKSFYNTDEKLVLKEFASLLNTYYNNLKRHFICGHNLKEFDVPYICRRMLVHGLPLPRLLDIAGAKPWETDHLIDTMQLWKFGDYKHFTSLELLANLFDIPTPKDDIEGSDVGQVFWQDNDLARIAEYCQKDVLTVAQLLLRFRREPLIAEENVIYVDK